MADSETADTLTYLYAIVPADAPEAPAGLTGIEDSAVRLVRTGNIAGVVSDVPADAYREDALNSQLDDLSWVGERGVAHERVVNFFADAGAVIPLSLFSLHADDDTVARRLASEAADYAELLGQLAGRREWGIRLWRIEAASEGIDQLSATITALNQQIEAAPQGKRFLLERKREQMRTEELRTVSKRVAHEIYAALAEAAADAVRVPIATMAGEHRVLLMNAAYLVRDDQFDRFQATVNDQAGRLVGSGFELEFTGPWPPYHFSTIADD